MNKEIKCYLCSTSFKRPYNLSIHLREFRCKSPLLDNLEELNNLLKNTMNKNEEEKVCNDGNKLIKVNPISQLDLTNNMNNNKLMLDKFDDNKCNENSLIVLLTEYIKNIIYNKNIPENMCITYIRRRQPMFNIVINNDKTITNDIKSAKDICDLYSEMFLKIIKKEMKNFTKYIKNIKKDNNNIDDDLLYDMNVIDTFKDLLRKENIINIISHSLKNVLNIYILYDKNMKYQG
jgi:hypothetical protein